MIIWMLFLSVLSVLVLVVGLVWTVQGIMAIWRQRQPQAIANPQQQSTPTIATQSVTDGSGFQVRVEGGATYVSESGVLLNTLWEILPNAECQAGECGGCRMRLLSGKVRWVTEPQIMLNRDKEFLPCSCVAISDLSCAK